MHFSTYAGIAKGILSVQALVQEHAYFLLKITNWNFTAGGGPYSGITNGSFLLLECFFKILSSFDNEIAAEVLKMFLKVYLLVY